MSNVGPWATENFDQMSWHDVHVHGLRFDTFKEDNGSADLVLDMLADLPAEKAQAAKEEMTKLSSN